AALGFLQTLVKAIPARKLHRAGHVAVELATVVVAAARRQVRKLLGPDEIAPPDLLARHVELASAFLDQFLDEESGLGAASATVGIHRASVGVDALHRHIHRLNVIDAG